jgi:RND family efflux transporter MFP subunit
MNQSPTPRSLRLKKLIAPLSVLVIASGIYLGLINTTAELDTTVKEPVPVAVRAITVEPETVNLKVYSEGNVQPRSQTNLLAQVAGEVVYVADTMLSGGQFQLGDTLLKLDPRDYEIARDRAQASLSRSQAELNFARLEAGRVRALYGDELASVADLQGAERLLAVAEASAMEATAALERANIDLERTLIRAPFNGRVRNESVDVGQFLQKGASIATVYDTERLEVKLTARRRSTRLPCAAICQCGQRR